MPGTEGLTHTESQTAWLQGKAAFIPCGNWLENEMKGLIPDTFNMVFQPTPSLAGRQGPSRASRRPAAKVSSCPPKARMWPVARNTCAY